MLLGMGVLVKLHILGVPEGVAPRAPRVALAGLDL